MKQTINIKDFVDLSTLVEGVELRLNHKGCPAGVDTRKRLYIKKLDGTILAYCHNCGNKGAISAKNRVLTRHKSIEDIAVKHTQQGFIPPSDLVDVDAFPESVLAYLFKYDFSEYAIQLYGIKYSPSLHRLAYPIYPFRSTRTVGYTMRAMDPTEKNKHLVCYKEQGADKTNFFTSSKDCIIIVEDYLSAARIGSSISGCVVCLNGTHLPVVTETVLAANFTAQVPVIIWLDPDSAGRTAALKVQRTLNPHFSNIIDITGRQDEAKRKSIKQVEGIINKWTGN